MLKRRQIRKLKRTIRRNVPTSTIVAMRRKLVQASRSQKQLKNKMSQQLHTKIKEAQRKAFAKAFAVFTVINARRNAARRKALALANAKFERDYNLKLAKLLRRARSKATKANWRRRTTARRTMRRVARAGRR